jgi:hypothetical protein
MYESRLNPGTMREFNITRAAPSFAAEANGTVDTSGIHLIGVTESQS